MPRITITVAVERDNGFSRRESAIHNAADETSLGRLVADVVSALPGSPLRILQSVKAHYIAEALRSRSEIDFRPIDLSDAIPNEEPSRPAPADQEADQKPARAAILRRKGKRATKNTHHRNGRG